MAVILLNTKLHAPPLRPNCVIRSRLLDRLNLGLARGCQVSLVCAPAGFGKTTLVTGWLGENHDAKTAWFSLEEGDNDIFVFLHYLLAALKKIDPRMDGAIWQKLEAGSAAEELLAMVINELSDHLADPVNALNPAVLVLDDYHCIHNPAVHEAMAFFVENKPSQLHIVITTRQDPLLPLSRWRARGQVNEIRLSDLRFNRDEAALFLNDNMGLGIGSEEVAVLEMRTEGWIAGLQLAAITIQQEQANGSPADFVRAFAGDNRYVMDYLMDEVLSRQPQAVQAFLLKTSILERMCAPLCAAICGQDLSEEQPGMDFSSAASILPYLERANLFLIPLDHQREWYRYHHLFAQLLRQRLVNEHGEAIEADLHRKAAAWFAVQGLTNEVVQHATQAKDFEWLADQLENTLRKPAVWSSGEIGRLVGWLNKLPAAVIEARPSLCMQVARSLHIAGDTSSGMTWLVKAERCLESQPPSEAKNHLLGIAAANWATFHVMQGEDRQALESAEQALSLLPAHDSLWRSRAMHAVALAMDELGDYAGARQVYEQIIELTQQTGNLFLAFSSMGNLASILYRMGNLRQAEAVCEQALALAKVNGQLTPAGSLAWLALAGMKFERNLLEEAEETIQFAIALADTGGIGLTIHNSSATAIICRCRLGRGDQRGAAEILRQIDQWMATANHKWLRQRFNQEAIRAHLALEFGDLAHASAWARMYEQTGPTEFQRELMDIVLARVYMAEAQIEKAQALLEGLLADASQHGRNYHVIEISILLSLIYSRQNKPDAARSLVRALNMAAAEGYARLFVMEGEAMRKLIREVRSSNLPALTSEFVDHLLTFYPSQPGTSAGTQANQGLVEPLTARELEVLGYLSEGMTLPEIAQKLYLSPNTLKAHSNTIYAKLSVHSRLQAVNKARALGLLADAQG